MNLDTELLEHFENFVTDNRRELFNRLLEKRTRYLTVVLEDIYQPHNASAVLRSCDCFGIQDVHIIEKRNEYEINKEVALGSTNWLNLNKYNESDNNSLEAIRTLKNKGYRIIATTPHTDDTYLKDFDITEGPAAIVFGTEKEGISEDIKNNADGFLKIPMHGFTESFNISVSAGIILYHLSLKLLESNVNWQLSNEEKQAIKLDWLRYSIKSSSLIEQEFYNPNKL